MSEGVLLRSAVFAGVLVSTRVAFGGTEASEVPLTVDEIIDENAGFGGGGTETLVTVLDELLELGDVFGGEDEGFGVDAGFEGIHGGSGLACNRGGAGGLLGVATIRFDLTQSGHKGLTRPSCARMDRPGGSSYFGGRAAISEIRGWMSVTWWIWGAKDFFV